MRPEWWLGMIGNNELKLASGPRVLMLQGRKLSG